MPFEQEFIDVLLAASPEYKEDMILDYTLLEAHVPTRTYADFAKVNATSAIYNMKIEPFELFLLMYPEPNAWACLFNDKYVMCIHLSLFNIIEKRVREKLPTASGIITKYPSQKELPADYLIYQ